MGVKECMKYLEEPILGGDTGEYMVEQIIKKVCESNPQVDRYIKLGVSKKDYFDRSKNKRARYIYERLMVMHPEIEIVNKNPTTIRLFRRNNNPKPHSDHSDHSAVNNGDTDTKNASTPNITRPNPDKGFVSYEPQKNITQKGVIQKTESERSEQSDKIVTQDRKKNKSCMGWSQPTEPNPNKYQCPECDNFDLLVRKKDDLEGPGESSKEHTESILTIPTIPTNHVICSKCNHHDIAFYMRVHDCERTD